MPRTFNRTLVLVGLLVLLIGLIAPPAAAAANGLTMDARALLNGHTRIGAWMGIEVDLANDGPAIDGELRVLGGASGQTRFAMAVSLPTQSRKTYVLYVQPPSFGDTVQVALVGAGDQVLATKSMAFTLHDPGQLIVGVLAEKPEGIARSLRLLPGVNGQQAAIVTLGQADLPDKVQAWTALDRLIWQDIDASTLAAAQIKALQGWLATGGRLIVTGGTGGASLLASLPDGLLPFRPTTTVDVAPASLASLLGPIPPKARATELPALAASSTNGRVLARSGDWVIAAETQNGSGAVTLLGFDPTVEWISGTAAGDALWRRLVPARGSSGAVVVTDDSQLLNAISNLPSLALPPVSGLIVLLVGYIVLIGPINYLVLRRLDRREWAWLTMPALIVVFATGAYGFGAALRGGDVIVDEVAIVRGAPDSTDGLGQVYVGVFSPSRTSYQLRIPGALVSSPVSGEGGQFGPAAAALDVVQGEPTVVRNLAVGFGSLRALRAETSLPVPRLTADLRLDGSRVVGMVRNLSDQTIEKPAVVLGSNVAILPDMPPDATQQVSMALGGPEQFGQALSDKIFGQVFFNGGPGSNEDAQRATVRHSVMDQLTFDPTFGVTGQLPADGAILLAWGSHSVLDVEVEHQQARQVGTVLYYIPVGLKIEGQAAFTPDLVQSTVVQVDATQFSRDPFNFNIAGGSITVAYRPTAFQGTLQPTKLTVGLGLGQQGVQFGGGGVVIGKPVPLPAPAVDGPAPLDNVPDVEVFDLTSGAWVRLPHLATGQSVVVQDPGHYVDPTTGTVQVRFTNPRQDMIGFQFGVQIEGKVR